MIENECCKKPENLTTEEVRGAFMNPAWTADEWCDPGAAFDAWLIAHDQVAFDRGYQQGAQYVAVLNTLWGKKPEREG